MAETRKLPAILAADVAGYGKLAAADEERTLAKLRALRSDPLDTALTVRLSNLLRMGGALSYWANLIARLRFEVTHSCRKMITNVIGRATKRIGVEVRVASCC